MDFLEKLARGVYSDDKTLVSEMFASGLERMFRHFECTDAKGVLNIRKLRRSL